MKKLASLIIIITLCMMLFFGTNSYAQTLDNISIYVNKTTVRPGEEVKLTINFGTELGAYTFYIAYDNNLFDYVSVDGGTVNDTNDKVIVEFHDTTGGSNARTNMSILFKAKDSITTSNPTEFTVTATGLSNADASAVYPDITIPIVKNIVVEPEYVEYKFNLEYTGEIIKEEEKEMKLSFSSSMGRHYEHARLIAEAITPTGTTVKLTGINNQENAIQDIIQSGWGAPQGYAIGGKNFEQVLNLKSIFSDEGNYKIKFKLIDRDSSDSIISEKEFNFAVISKNTINTPTTSNITNITNTTQNTTNTISNITKNITNNTVTEMPKKLPKTGANYYVPLSISIGAIVFLVIYYNIKRK